MYCVFSKALLRHYAKLCGVVPTEEDYSNIKASKLLKPEVNAIFMAFIYNPHQTDEETDKLIGPTSSYEMSLIIKWIEKNIVPNIKYMKLSEFNVKLRIVTCMMYKLIQHKKTFPDMKHPIPDYSYPILCNNFVSNFRDLRSDISLEDLPF